MNDQLSGRGQRTMFANRESAIILLMGWSFDHVNIDQWALLRRKIERKKELRKRERLDTKLHYSIYRMNK